MKHFSSPVRFPIRIPIWALMALVAYPVHPTWAQDGAPAKPATKPDPNTAAKAKLEIVNEGELRLDGKITGLTGEGTWQMQAISWTSPRGVTTDFDDPKNKGVSLATDAYIHPRGELEKVPAKELKLGDHIAVIGKNGAEGGLVAREVILLEGYGSRKTVGQLSINPVSWKFVSDSRAAHDAGLLPKALTSIESAITTAQGMDDTSGEALATQDKALLLADMGQMDKALAAEKRVEALGRALNNPLAMTLGMRGAGSILLLGGKYNDAIAELKEADPLSAGIKKELNLEVLSTLAMAYLAAGNLNDGVATLNRVHPLESQLGKDASAMETRLTIAALQATDSPDAARKAIEDAKASIDNAPNDAVKASLISATALINWRLDEKDAARTGFTDAANLYRNAGSTPMAKRWDEMAKSLEAAGDGWQEFFMISSGLKDADDAPGDEDGTKTKDAPPAGA